MLWELVYCIKIICYFAKMSKCATSDFIFRFHSLNIFFFIFWIPKSRVLIFFQSQNSGDCKMTSGLNYLLSYVKDRTILNFWPWKSPPWSQIIIFKITKAHNDFKTEQDEPLYALVGRPLVFDLTICVEPRSGSGSFELWTLPLLCLWLEALSYVYFTWNLRCHVIWATLSRDLSHLVTWSEPPCHVT